MGSVSFDSSLVAPLPKDLIGSPCSECDKPQAVWKLTRSAAELPFVCSWCLLYKSRWGEDNKKDIDSLISALEARLNRLLERSEDGKLLLVHDANRIMFAVVATNRVFALRTRLENKASQ